MDYKPKDLFLSAIDIFAIFFPGAIMLFLRLDFVSTGFNNLFHIPSSGVEFWTAFIIAAYLAGQFLIASTVIFNKAENAYKSKKVANDPIFLYVKENIPHEKDENLSRLKSFYRAYSFIRLYNASGLSEIEKQAADYKLFRSLTLVALLECIFSLLLGQWIRAIVAIAISMFCFWRFMYLRSQTEMLALEYFYLLSRQEKKTKVPSKTAT
ncbi:MAG: hypothetical protein HY869_01160 [Chloroflexi bacterium]|nr:hypothetical protein [Chloroflexota bacterium]